MDYLSYPHFGDCSRFHFCNIQNKGTYKFLACTISLWLCIVQRQMEDCVHYLSQLMWVIGKMEMWDCALDIEFLFL